jgi:ureidoglycolate hydrolase
MADTKVIELKVERLTVKAFASYGEIIFIILIY